MFNYLYNLATDKYKGFFPAVFKTVLFLLSLVYGLIIRGLMFISRLKQFRPGCKVISVGNITLGGTGKTPLVEHIGRYLTRLGHKVAVVTRGYKREHRSTGAPEHRNVEYERMGDEACMLKRNLGDVPIIVDADRRRGIKQAIKDYGVDTVIFDDGFQQWNIKKDLEIVVIDATNPFGNEHMLPRGILRQPLSSLNTADIFVLTKTNFALEPQGLKNNLITEPPTNNGYIICRRLSKINPKAQIIESIHSPAGFYELNSPHFSPLPKGEGRVREEPVAVFSGIADPDSFENLIKSLGIDIAVSFRFPDHHNYIESDLDKIIAGCKAKNIDTVVITEKDAVKLPAFSFQSSSVKIFVLHMELKITKNEEEFDNRLLKLYSL